MPPTTSAADETPVETSAPSLTSISGLLPLFLIGGVALIAFLPKIEDARLSWTIYGLGIALCVSAIVMIFFRLWSETKEQENVLPASLNQAELAVRQLTMNYDVLRRQTSQGFLLSGGFMAAGLVVIVVGSAGPWLGLQGSASSLTTVAGILMEFISGTALLLYRMNFKRLNDTTDRLDRAWRIFTAHQIAETLKGTPEGTEATKKLIDALLRPDDASLRVAT